LRKLKRELRNCEAAVFMNLFIDFRHQFISHNGMSATSLFIVNISAAIFKQCTTALLRLHLLLRFRTPYKVADEFQFVSGFPPTKT